MLTEEQIQRLAKKLSEEHDVDEEECKEHVRFIDNFSEAYHALLPEERKEDFKKALEGEFFEGLIQRSFSLGKQVREIYWMFRLSVDKKSLEEDFFEDLLQKSSSIAKQIHQIYWMCRLRGVDKL